MDEKTLKIGIISPEQFWKRSIAIAKGEIKPSSDDPKVWFESLQSASQVLSNDNQKLLKTIVDMRPSSLKELEAISGRKSSSLCRTLKTMERYGIVDLVRENKHVKPIVNATRFQVEFGL